MDEITENSRLMVLKIKNVYQKYKDDIEIPKNRELKVDLLFLFVEKEEGIVFANELRKAMIGYCQYENIYIIAAKDDKGSEVLLEFNNENLRGLDYFKSKVKSFIDYGGDANKGEYILNSLFSYNDSIFYYEYDSPLNFAIKHNDMETAKLLLDNGADINKQFNEYDYEHDCSCYSNAIINVCIYGSNDFIKFIMDEYMKKNSFSKVSDIPDIKQGLLILFRKQKFESIRLLFEYDFIYQTLNNNDLSKILYEIRDSDPDFNSEERCINNLEEKMIKTVEFYISYGININKKYDRYEETILTNAVVGKFPRFTIFLIENGLTMDEEKYRPDDIKFYNECYDKYMKFKSKERSDLLREDLVMKYYSPENIEKWGLKFNKPFDEVQEIM
jgi:hypothetical protein